MGLMHQHLASLNLAFLSYGVTFITVSVLIFQIKNVLLHV